MVFIFQFVNVVNYIDLRILKNPCIPGIKPTWSWCMIFLMCCWILIARISLRIFASMFISDIGLQFSFFVACLSGFGIRVMAAVTICSDFGAQKNREQLTSILLKLFEKIAEEDKLTNSFYETTITLIPEPDKDATKRHNPFEVPNHR